MADDVQQKTIRIVVDASGARDGAAAVEKALSSIDDKLAALGQSVTSTFSTIKNALLAFVSFDAILTQVRGLIEAFDKLGQRAQTLGVSTQWMQAFEFAAASSSVKIADAGSALEKFSRLVGEGARGQKEAVETLRDLGVKIFDAQKNVRPLSDLLEEAAKKLDGMESSAKRNALAASAVGRDWARVVPIFGAVAQGQDEMIRKAEKAGAIVKPEMVKIWEDLASAADKSMLKWRAFAGENFAESVKKGFELIAEAIGLALDKLKSFAGFLSAAWGEAKAFARESMVSSGREQYDSARAAWPAAHNELQGATRQRLILEGTIANGDSSRLGADRLTAAVDAERKAAARIGDLRSQITRGANLAFSSSVAPPSDGGLPPVGRGDFGLPPLPEKVLGVGGGNNFATANDPSIGDRRNKRIEALKAEEEATRRMADAALIGAAAVAKEQAEFKALQQALEIMGPTAKSSDEAVQQLQKTLVKADASIASNKLVEKFRLETKELEGQNSIAAKRLELIGAAPEVAAREIALLTVRNQIAKEGGEQSKADFAGRVKAVEQQELLNRKMEDAKKLQELWLAPVKQALSNIQTTAADAFDKILESGKISFESLGQIIIKTLRRAAAEMLALATIRPVLGFVVQSIGGSALSSQLGFGSSAGGLGALGGLASLFGSNAGGGGGGGTATAPAGGGGAGGGLGMLSGLGSIGSLFGGGGGIGSMFRSAGGWLSGLFSGGGAAAPMMANAAGPLGGLGSSIGSAGASAGGISGLISAIPVWGWITAAATIAKQFTAGKPSNTLLGAADTLLAPSLDQWMSNPARSAFNVFNPLGPAGAAVAGLFGFDPFGDKGPFVPPQPPLLLNVGAFTGNASGRYTSSGFSAGGGASLQKNARGLAAQTSRYFAQAGLTPIAGQVFGGELLTGIDHQRSGDGWQDRPYSQVGLTRLGQPNEYVTWNDSSRNPQQAAELLLAEVFKANVLRGGVSGASDTLKSAITNVPPETADDVDKLIKMTRAYDDLVKGDKLTEAEKALRSIGESFADVTSWASEMGLALEPIEDARLKAESDYAKSFKHSIDMALDPVGTALADFVEQRGKEALELAYINDNIKGVVIETSRFNEYQLKKEAALKDQLYGGAVESLRQAIEALTLGPLANLSPTTQLSAMQATYGATLAQARAGDASAIARLAGEGTGLATSGQQYFASGPQYEAMRQEIVANFLEIQARVQSPQGGAPLGEASAAQQAQNQQFMQLVEMFKRSEAARDEERRQNSELRDLLQRLVTK